MVAKVAVQTSNTEIPLDEFIVLSHTLSGWDDPNDKANRQPHLWSRGETVRLDPGGKRTAELVRMGAVRWVGAPEPQSPRVMTTPPAFDATIDPQ